MSDERTIPERRADNRKVLEDLREKIEKVHDRVYNGLGKEIREEVKKAAALAAGLTVGSFYRIGDTVGVVH